MLPEEEAEPAESPISSHKPEPEELVGEKQAEEKEDGKSAKSVKTKRIKKENEAEGTDKEPEIKKNRRKEKKVSHKPKAPPSSFLLFFKDQQGRIATAYPSYGVTELTKVAAKLWSEYTAEEKDPYVQLCNEERRLYQERMQKYRLEFPEEIAEREKDRKIKRKMRTGIRETPKKEKNTGEGVQS